MATVPAIVVGVDESAASARALRWAVREARRRGLPIRAVMVWESHAVLAGPAPMLMRPDLAPHCVRERHLTALRRIIAECGGAADLDMRAELDEGHPANVLAEKSAGEALLVLGDHGRGRFAEAMLGSTALHTIRRAQCPVVIVPSGMREIPEQPGRGSVEVVGRDPVLD